MNGEIEHVRARYAKRISNGKDARYSILNPDVWKSVQERQRALISLLVKHSLKPIDELQVIEIGCGTGGNLLELLRMGFQPENLMGVELLKERFEKARRVLPDGMVHLGDASGLNIRDASFDIVYQSTVFSSLLDSDFQAYLARKMWSWAKPGGGVLYYDFIYNNPNNPDVRGVSIKRIKELFPLGKPEIYRVTLAPPIARRVCKIHSALYDLFNAFPFLRTHVLCWIGKSCTRE